MKTSGFDRVQRKLKRLPKAVQEEFDRANKENADLIADTAKVLIPSKSGRSRAAIKTRAVQDGGQLIDFGPKSKVIEGERGPRPFVNPAMRMTKVRRRKRNKKAVREAAKKVT